MAVRSGSVAINSSAVHVFEVLRLVSRAEEPLGVSEISRRLGLPASTVYRALITLEESAYIVRFQNMPRYELGSMPQLLNRALVHRFQLHASSRPFLRSLSESTGQTVSLIVRIGWYGLSLAAHYGARDIYHREALGEVSLLHEKVPGRAILSLLSADEIDAYQIFVERHHSDRGPIDAQKLVAEWKDAAQDGVVYADREGGAAPNAAAVPVRDAGGHAIAALTVSGLGRASAKDVSKWLAARDALEAEIRLSPPAFRSPFADIPVDEIIIRLPFR